MMKRTLVPLTVGFLAAACGGAEPSSEMAQPPMQEPLPAAPVAESEAPPADKPAVSMEDALKQFVEQTDASWAAKDTAKLKSLYAPGAVIAMPGAKGMEESSPADFDKRMPGYFSAFPDVQHKTIRAIQKGDVAVTQWVVTGTNKGDFMGEKATGKPIGYAGASVVWLDADGKVKREHVYFDMGTMMGQLGKGQKGQKHRAALTAPEGATAFIVAKPGDEKNAASLRNFYTLLDKDDDKGASALLADDVVSSSAYMHEDIKGKKAVEKDMAAGKKAFVDDKTEVSQCIAAGDFAACEFAWTATWKGWAMGMAATGKTGTVHGLELARFKDGKLAETHGYANGVEFAVSFGLVKEQPPKAPAKPQQPSASKGQGEAPKSGATQPAKADPNAPTPSAPVKK